MPNTRKASSDLPESASPAAALRQAREQLHGRPSPPALSSDFPQGDIAYRLQADQHGDLSLQARRRLAALARGEPARKPHRTSRMPKTADTPLKGSLSSSPPSGGTPSALRIDATPDELSERVAALASLDLEDLRIAWRKLYRSTPPLRLSRDLLQRSIAHRLQEEALGGLSAAAQRQLAALARSSAANGKHPPIAPAVKLKPGTTLVREWHGRTHTVTVQEKGFEHDGKRYASLTQIAQLITGAHWSGPRFFGLRRAAKHASRGGPEGE